MNPIQICESIAKHLEDAWNAGSGEKFAEPFTSTSDFVNIRGMFLSKASKQQVAHGHQHIFDTIYKGSTLQYNVTDAEFINEDTILAHIKSELDSDFAELGGIRNSIITIVLIQEEDEWKIRAFHNTLIAQQ
jgi:uncharacterized protein (TIGR02246 family)